MSPRWNWDSPTPLAASECALPPGSKGGGAHSPSAKGVGESQFQRLEKRLALCLLCGLMFSNELGPKLFQQHWRHLKGNYDLNSAFENADKTKRTGISFTILRH